MALLTREAEEKIINLLLGEGLADANLIYAVKEEAERENKPILSELVNRKLISDDMVAHATALIIGVPYVELKNIDIDLPTISSFQNELLYQFKQFRILKADRLICLTGTHF